MFSRKDKPKYQYMIESELERSIRSLATEMVSDQDYAKKLGIVERLHEMMDKDKEIPSTMSNETLLAVGANLLGIILIIKHEAVNVITSKALSFVIRTRI